MRSYRCFSTCNYVGAIRPMLTFLISTTLLVHAESGAPNVSQSVVADSSNNGLSSPGAVAVDADENLFIADTGNNRVLEEPWNKSTKTYGAQTVLIGNLANPNGVAVSKSGSVFVADTGNNRIIEIPWNSALGTFGAPAEVGSGLDGPRGVTVAADGDVYIADTGNDRVVEVPFDRDKQSYGSQTTVGNNLLRPAAVAVDPGGKIYIANLGDSSVVDVPAGCNAANSCTSQTTVASQQTNGIASPTGVAVGTSGNLYIADTGNNRVILLPWSLSANA
jgi:sugar lactone lactonase YvrE